MKDLVFMGIQGSGKGTQAKLLLQAMPETYAYFGTGDIYRALMSVDDAFGNHIKDRIENGLLLEDNITNALFGGYFYTVLQTKKHMLLDGYPRTLSQCANLLNATQEHKRDILLVEFVLPHEEAHNRMLQRGRHDDTPETIATRIEQFHTKKKPIIDFMSAYAEVVEVDTSGPIEEVAQRVKALVTQ